jgi:RNA-directed DNA polymerase
MNRTIKEATVQRFYYESHQQLRQHLADCVAAYNFGRRLNPEGAHALRIHLQKLDFSA